METTFESWKDKTGDLMAVFRKRGHSFEKNFVIFSRKRNRIIFGLQFSIGLNANDVQSFGTASWFSLGGGFWLHPEKKIPGIFLRWNKKPLS